MGRGPSRMRLHPLKTKCPNDRSLWRSRTKTVLPIPGFPPPCVESVFWARLETTLIMSTHGGHLLFWDDCHLESGDFLTVCLFLDKGEENWTKAGILTISSSCRAEPMKTSAPAQRVGGGQARVPPWLPAQQRRSARHSGQAQRECPKRHPGGCPLLRVSCRSPTGSAPSSSVAVGRLEPPPVLTPPGGEEPPLGSSETRKEAGKPIPAAKTTMPRASMTHTSLQPFPGQQLQE